MISLLCPSRSRTENLRRLIISVRNTEWMRSEIIVCVDDDDPAYPPELDSHYDCKIIRGPRICHSDLWNRAAEHSSGNILMMVGDDCLFKTPGWDLMMEGAFAVCPDKILMVHGDDCNPHGTGVAFATHPAISRKWYEITGKFTGPWFPADYADTWIQDIAEGLGRRWCLPMITDHLHPVWGKARKDQVYIDNERRKREFNTPRIYLDHKIDRCKDQQKLYEAMDANWRTPLVIS